ILLARRHPMANHRPSIGNSELLSWVDAVARYTHPDQVHWCDGSDKERVELERTMVAAGSLIELDHKAHPGSYLHRSDPTDVARTEHLTFISTAQREDCGPTNNWMSKAQAEGQVWPLFSGSMRGRTMYVVPYVMGPVGSRFSRLGVEITDSPYVVLNLRTMTRMGDVAHARLDRPDPFLPGIH